MSMEMTELAERLARAEGEIAVLRTAARRSRRSRTVLEVSVVAVLAIVMASTRWASTQAQGVGQTITGPFVVKGAGGNKIFEVKESSDKEQSQVLLFNGQEQVRVAIITSGGNGFVGVKAAQGDRNFVAALTADADGSGLLEIGDKDGKKIVSIKKGPKAQGLVVYRPGTDNKIAVAALSSTEDASMSVMNDDGVGSGIGVNDDALLEVMDRSGEPIVQISGAADAAPGQAPTPGSKRERGLRMYSAQGNLAVRADVDAKGSGHVGVLAEDGSQGLLGINSSGSGSEMLLAGPTAKVTVNLSSTEGLEMYSQTERAPVVGLYFKERGGKLVIADNAGTIMLEGGITESGRGIFFAGPRIGGGIPATGLPFAIEGQK